MVSELTNSEKLYKLSIDIGNGETKQVTFICTSPFEMKPNDIFFPRSALV